MSELKIEKVRRLIREALAEDIGPGDITTRSIIPGKKMVKAEIVAKEAGIIGGLPIAKEVFRLLDRKIRFVNLVKEGGKVKKGKRIALITGNARLILSGERVALNFIQRLSGIATETNRCVKEVLPFKTAILDTRKTPAGWRYLDKYAVRLAGGKNHRFGLYDMILIKDNHLALGSDIREAVRRARTRYPDKKIEIEVKNFKELSRALAMGVDIVMLDNMNINNIMKALKLIKGRCKVEVSGNIPFRHLRRLARLGVDYISLGRLTHSPRALDISLKIVKER